MYLGQYILPVKVLCCFIVLCLVMILCKNLTTFQDSWFSFGLLTACSLNVRCILFLNLFFAGFYKYLSAWQKFDENRWWKKHDLEYSSAKNRHVLGSVVFTFELVAMDLKFCSILNWVSYTTCCLFLVSFSLFFYCYYFFFEISLIIFCHVVYNQHCI